MSALHEERYQPRDTDHLVEPMFAGLGTDEADWSESEDTPQGGLVQRLFAFLRLGRGASGAGPRRSPSDR
jgi:hypothetical protein